MGKNRWLRVDSVMRWAHLYTGLVLVPWMLVYAVSAFCLNRGAWINERFSITPPTWSVVRTTDFAPADPAAGSPKERALAILKHLDLDGPHHIPAGHTIDRMVIIRASGGGNYRITWRRADSQIVVERQPFSPYRLLHFLHFRHGYRQPYLPHIVWGLLVDATAICLFLWVVSGVYLALRRPRRRAVMGACVVAGSVLFMVLVLLLCL